MCRTRSRRLADMLNLNGQLFYESVSDRDFLTGSAVSENHLIESISKHCSTFFKVLDFGEHLGPFNQLPHVSWVDFCVFAQNPHQKNKKPRWACKNKQIECILDKETIINEVKAIMTQGILPFKYEKENQKNKMTGFGGIPVYLDLAQAGGLPKSIDKHIKASSDSQGWTDRQVIINWEFL